MCPTCPFRGQWPGFRQPVSREEVLAALHSEHVQGPPGWNVGECHDRVGEPCAGYHQLDQVETTP